jgi:hypothetical protein
VSAINLKGKLAMIYRVIELNPGVQDSEPALIAAVWKYEGWNEFDTLERNLQKVTHPETISRRRRELYNRGLIHYSSDALEVREEAYKNERDYHGKPLFQPSLVDCE